MTKAFVRQFAALNHTGYQSDARHRHQTSLVGGTEELSALKAMTAASGNLSKTTVRGARRQQATGGCQRCVNINTTENDAGYPKLWLDNPPSRTRRVTVTKW